MNDKQQTAVDILCGKLAMKLGIPQAITFYIDHQEEIREAKEMEKQQIAKAFDDGDYNYHYSRKTGNDFEDGEEYFNELYGTEKL